MAAEPQLDAAGGARKGRVIVLLALILMPGSPVSAQNYSSDEARLSAAQKAFDDKRWEEAVSLARGPADQSPDLAALARGSQPR